MREPVDNSSRLVRLLNETVFRSRGPTDQTLPLERSAITRPMRPSAPTAVVRPTATGEPVPDQPDYRPLWAILPFACLLIWAWASLLGDGGSESSPSVGSSVRDCGAAVGEEHDVCLTSDALRRTILRTCGLDDWQLEREWWKDSDSTIQFNYAGDAGITQGASIDVVTGEVTYCR